MILFVRFFIVPLDFGHNKVEQFARQCVGRHGPVMLEIRHGRDQNKPRHEMENLAFLGLGQFGRGVFDTENFVFNGVVQFITDNTVCTV